MLSINGTKVDNIGPQKRVNGQLTVKVLDAKDLAPMDLNGTSDPFCVVSITGQQDQTAVKKKTLAPVWNQSFRFDITQFPLQLSVIMFDEDLISKADFMGAVTIVVDESLAHGSTHTQWYPLAARHGRKKDKAQGEIRLSISYTLEEAQAVTTATAIFGKELDEVMNTRFKGLRVPPVVKSCCEFLYRNGLQTEGLFRIAGSAAEKKQLAARFDKGEDVQFSSGSTDVNVVGDVLRMYLRELPEPLIPKKHYRQVIDAAKTKDTVVMVQELKKVIGALTPAHYNTLNLVCFLAKSVAANAAQNLMTSSNIAVVFGPVVFRSDSKNLSEQLSETSQVGLATQLLIDQYDALFGGAGAGAGAAATTTIEQLTT